MSKTDADHAEEFVRRLMRDTRLEKMPPAHVDYFLRMFLTGFACMALKYQERTRVVASLRAMADTIEGKPG